MIDLPETPLPHARRPWSGRLSRVRTRVRWAGPFALGIAAALIAVMLYGVMVPGPRPLTQQDVGARIAQALASQTAGPALSQGAYQAVAPALVMIEAQGVSSSPAPSSSAPAAPTASPVGSPRQTTRPAAPSGAASSWTQPATF